MYADAVELPTFATAASMIDISFCCCGPSHAGTDRWTDMRMDTVPFHRPSSAYYAGSANNFLYYGDIVASAFFNQNKTTAILHCFPPVQASCQWVLLCM